MLHWVALVQTWPIYKKSYTDTYAVYMWSGRKKKIAKRKKFHAENVTLWIYDLFGYIFARRITNLAWVGDGGLNPDNQINHF